MSDVNEFPDVVELPYTRYEKIRKFFNEFDDLIVDLENERDRFSKQSKEDEIARVLSYHYSEIVKELKKLKELV